MINGVWFTSSNELEGNSSYAYDNTWHLAPYTSHDALIALKSAYYEGTDYLIMGNYDPIKNLTSAWTPETYHASLYKIRHDRLSNHKVFGTLSATDYPLKETEVSHVCTKNFVNTSLCRLNNNAFDNAHFLLQRY